MVRSDERVHRCCRAQVSKLSPSGLCCREADATLLLRLIRATFAVIALLVLGSPAFALDPSGNGAAWPIPTQSLSQAGDSLHVSGNEPPLLASSRQVAHTPVPSGQLAQLDEAKALIASHHAEIFDDPDSPVGGSDSGDVTIVEFFDYNCPYCRLAVPTLQEIERTDPKVRFVYKEFPILGPGSDFAARAALAANRQGKYMAFHRALMASDERIAEGTTIEIARSIGLDTA